MRPVSEFMSSPVQAVEVTADVGRVRDLALEGGAHALPVVDEDGELVGIVTTHDLAEEWPPELGVVSIMSREVVTVPPTVDAATAAVLMRDRRIHHLLVLDLRGRVVGVVSSWDLLARLAEDVQSLTASATVRPRVEAGDELVAHPLDGEQQWRARILEVHGPDGAPPWVIEWDDDPGHQRVELSVVRHDDHGLDGCER